MSQLYKEGSEIRQSEQSFSEFSTLIKFASNVFCNLPGGLLEGFTLLVEASRHIVHVPSQCRALCFISPVALTVTLRVSSRPLLRLVHSLWTGACAALLEVISTPMPELDLDIFAFTNVETTASSPTIVSIGQQDLVETN